MAIGLTEYDRSSANNRSNSRLGTKENEIGYYGDDGGIYHNRAVTRRNQKPQSVQTGESYTTGDVVGCLCISGVIMAQESMSVVFTKNGQKAGTVKNLREADLYPTIGMRSSGHGRIEIETNFGENGFFDSRMNIFAKSPSGPDLATYFMGEKWENFKEKFADLLAP